MRLNNERGIALVIGLFVLITLMGFSTMFVIRTVHESNATKAERELVKAFYLAEAGSESALMELDTLINDNMQSAVNATNPAVVINDATSFVASNDGVGFLIDYVENISGTELLTAIGDQAIYTVHNAALGDGENDISIIISEKTDPVTVTPDTWDFSYDYKIYASGSAEVCSTQVSKTDLEMVTGTTTLTTSSGGFNSSLVGCYVHIVAGTNFVPGYYKVTGFNNTNSIDLSSDATDGSNGSNGWGDSSSGYYRNVAVNGDFTVRVQRDNFARYALFTNTQTTPGGSNVWFTSNTNFNGPIHTNGRFNIYGNPSGTFYGVAEQHEQEARFYNGSSPSILADADYNGTVDVPNWAGGFNRGVDSISLSSPVQEQDMIDQATGGTSISSWGIHVPNSGGALTGGIFVKGDSNITMSVDASNNAVYDITRGSTRKIITVDRVGNTTTVETYGGSTDVYTGLPDGVDDVGTIIYVDGDIDSIGGTVQADTELTVASYDDITIQDHIVYESYTAAVGSPGDAGYVAPSAEGHSNLLGLVAWGGDIRIGTSAPDDINVHASTLSRDGVIRVVNHNDWGEGPRGVATLLGGVISDNYGAFGQFNASTGEQGSGYGRNFVYDERMQQGSAPPYFPSLNTFIAFTNDITDKLIFEEGGL
jgi:hypothetical protein